MSLRKKGKEKLKEEKGKEKGREKEGKGKKGGNRRILDYTGQ